MTFGASETDATAQASAPGFLSPGARVQPSPVECCHSGQFSLRAPLRRGRRTSAVAVGRSPVRRAMFLGRRLGARGTCRRPGGWRLGEGGHGNPRSGLVTVILLAGIASLRAHLLCVVRPGPLNPLLEDLNPAPAGLFRCRARETNPAPRRLTEWACWPTPGDALATSLSASAVWTGQGQQAQRAFFGDELSPASAGLFRLTKP
jgi:hypothetical protein